MQVNGPNIMCMDLNGRFSRPVGERSLLDRKRPGDTSSEAPLLENRVMCTSFPTCQVYRESVKAPPVVMLPRASIYSGILKSFAHYSDSAAENARPGGGALLQGPVPPAELGLVTYLNTDFAR